MVTDSQLSQAAGGDIAALSELDGMGFLLGAEESGADLAARVTGVRESLAAMSTELARDGACEVDGLRFAADEQIPPELFSHAGDLTERLYGFRVTWVPGFFVSRSLGWFFGGCAYHFPPHYFALFIIRRAFATRDRWLFYRRDELLAHEQCHIARVRLNSAVFEEYFAYQTSDSRFRRSAGWLFRGPRDSYLVLAAAGLLLFAQMIQSFAWAAMPVWPFWIGVAGVAFSFFLRQRRQAAVMRKARARLADSAIRHPGAVLFRCTDAEIAHLARLAPGPAVAEWIAEQIRGSLRWRVISRRFLEAECGDAVQVGGESPTLQ
jgi:hypothetical protein